MTESEFQTQFTRLVDTFGKTAYSTERAKMIWNTVKPLSGDWFKRTCDSFIGSLRHAPLLPDFEDAAVNERERVQIFGRALEREAREAEWAREAVDCPPEFREKLAKFKIPGVT